MYLVVSDLKVDGFSDTTRQSVACNARRHPVVEHQDTCTCKHYYNSLLK